MRSASARWLALCLAVLPALWGNCPCWFTDASCCPKMTAQAHPGAGGREALCPCCASRAAKRSPVASTTPVAGPTDDDHRRDSDGCPVLEVRHLATPAPAAVDLPGHDLAVAILPLDLGSLSLGRTASTEAEPVPGLFDPCGPPGFVETTVLRI